MDKGNGKKLSRTEVVRKSCGGACYMVILGNFTDKVTFEQKYEGKRGEVVEFWVVFF